jgi:hypothetical protein
VEIVKCEHFGTTWNNQETRNTPPLSTLIVSTLGTPYPVKALYAEHKNTFGDNRSLALTLIPNKQAKRRKAPQRVHQGCFDIKDFLLP